MRSFVKDKRSQMFFLAISVLLIGSSFLFFTSDKSKDKRIISHKVDLSKQALLFYYKAEGNRISNFKNLKNNLSKQNKKLVFAMNGGMYLKDGSPQGLYIENGQTIKSLDTNKSGYGNFYMSPNGVFLITKSNKAFVCKTSALNEVKDIKYATQSGPMLVIDGELHSKFMKGSKNVHIRNGVGILPNGELLFAISKERVNFYDFALFFKNAGCENALYLDGFVSRMYLPQKKWFQEDGNFGVIIAETK